MLTGEPDIATRPLRRIGIATFAGVMVGAVLIAGAAVWGLLRPGNQTTWQTADDIIVEEGTGTRYIYRDDRLWPVLNYASARLLLGKPDAQVRDVSAKSLEGTPRATTVGIPGAPDALPAPGRLTATPWNVCTGTTTDTPQRPYVAVLPGTTLNGQTLGNDSLLVQPPNDQVYLLTNSHRFAIRNPDETLAALGWLTAPVHTVGPAFLSTVPAGPDLEPPPISSGGSAGPALGAQAQTQIGEIFEIGDSSNYAVLLSDGLAAIPRTAAAIMLSGRSATKILAADFADAPLHNGAVVPDGYPNNPQPPGTVELANGAILCTRYDVDATGTHSTEIVTLMQPPAGLAAAPASPKGGSALPQADRVIVNGGTGALIRAVPAPGVTTGTIYLITDQGIRYPIASTVELEALGYGTVSPVPIPTDLLDVLFIGPALSAEAATHPLNPAGK